jgi:hypothetical protein
MPHNRNKRPCTVPGCRVGKVHLRIGPTRNGRATSPRFQTPSLPDAGFEPQKKDPGALCLQALAQSGYPKGALMDRRNAGAASLPWGPRGSGISSKTHTQPVRVILYIDAVV